jgi:hypothetical protein
MTVEQLIEKLSKIEDKTMEVFAVHGASGVSYRIGTPSVQTVRDSDVGDVLDLPEGKEYIQLYVGS